MSRLRDDLVWVIGASAVYTLLSFCWSFLGFLGAPVPSAAYEYTSASFAVEVGGHVLFGLVAGAFTRSLRLALLLGVEAIAIDVDHVISTAGYQVVSRLAHSVFFLLAAATLLGFATRGGKRFNTPVFLVTAGAVLSHMSYDALAGDGVFPLLSPFSLAYISFPYASWLPFEALAVCLAFAAGWVLRRRA
jgi:LexA-binding, inner membrane-associated putative hydrolase